jgi:acyl dehydratase
MSANDPQAVASRPPRQWEDLVVGETTQSRVMTVDLDDMLAYAERYDPQWFHANPDAARASLFGEVVASGLYTAALWRVLDHEANGDVNWVCAVRAGDRLQAHSEVLSKRPSASRPGIGLAVLAHRLTDQDGETVFEFTSTDLVYRRDGAA